MIMRISWNNPLYNLPTLKMHREISRFFEAARLAHPPIRGSLSLSLSPIAHSNYAKYRLMNTYGQLLSLIHCCCLLYIKQRPTICPVVDRISAYGEGSNEPLPVPRGVPPLRPRGGGGGRKSKSGEKVCERERESAAVS